MGHHEPKLLAITRDMEWYEAQLEVMKDCRALLKKILAHLDGETEKVSDDGNAEPA